MKLKVSITLWLTVTMMGVLTSSLPTSTPTSTRHSAANSKRAYREKKQRSPNSRIRPIATKPLQVMHDSDAALAANFLTMFGYFRQGKPLHFLQSPPSGDGSSDQDPQSKAIKLFQSYFNLPQTGQLDRATVGLMKRDRCGVADIPEEEDNDSAHVTNRHSQSSPAGYTLLGSKWDRNRLTWKLDTASTNQLPPYRQRQIMTEAFNAWRRVAPLDFTERSSGKVDIDIKFGAKHHGDDFPFDGSGKVLAHAFGPGETSIDGDMHFDDEEDWAKDQSNDLYLVATHELGHSLGLSHSRDPGALMYPYYGLTDKLGADDIKAIQSLYGIRIGQPTTTPTPTRTTVTPRLTTKRPITRAPYTRRPTHTDRPRPQTTTTTSTPAKECGVEFDVVIQDPEDKEVYSGILGEKVYKFNTGGLLPAFPAPLHSVFPDAPSHADNVFTVPEKSATYFLKGNKVWRYQGSQREPDYPKDLDPTHFPEVVRFVLPIVDSTGHRRIFVFGRTLWWEYNFDDVRIGRSYRPRVNLIPQYWPAVSSDVSYAVMGSDNYVYLIAPQSYVVLDSFRRALYGGKLEGHPAWMQSACHMKMTSSGSADVKNFATVSLLTAVTLLLYLL